MAVKAKFYVAEITQRSSAALAGWAEPVPVGDVVMRPVTRGEDNKVWASSTPSGEFRMTVRGEAFPWFQERLGKEVSITLEDAEETTTP